MKKRNMILISLLLVLGLLITACDGVEEDEEEFEEIITANYQYINNNVIFEAIVNKPSPCHDLSYDYYVYREQNESIVDIRFVISETDEICAQVITAEDISGEFEVVELIGDAPDVIKFSVEHRQQI